MTTNVALRPTGVPGLDAVLGGGLSRDALVFITGTAGAGKTILGSQILFNAARQGQAALILTAFSEGHVKLLDHLRPLEFFDQDLVGSSVTLLSAQALIGEQLDVAAASLVRTIRESGARLVLLDGFQGVAALFPDPLMVRRLLALLAGQLTYIDVTMLVTLEGSARDPALMLEIATADVVIGLDYEVIGWRHVRRLEIVKQRGRGLLGGLHPYRIDSRGMNVFPRLESLPHPLPAPGAPPWSRQPFGLPELDALLGGGPSVGTTTVLAGAPGTGKTTLGLHWGLADARPDEASLLLTFQERPERLVEHARVFGLDLDPAIASGVLKVQHMPAVELDPDLVGAVLLEFVASGTVRRLIIDDLRPLFMALGARGRDYFAALVEHLFAAGTTSLFLLDIEPFVGLQFDIVNTPIAHVADNVVIVQQQTVAGQIRRLLAVLKMRYTDHDLALRELVMNAGGIRVLAPAETEPGVLAAAENAGARAAEARHQ